MISDENKEKIEKELQRRIAAKLRRLPREVEIIWVTIERSKNMADFTVDILYSTDVIPNRSAVRALEDHVLKYLKNSTLAIAISAVKTVAVWVRPQMYAYYDCGEILT